MSLFRIKIRFKAKFTLRAGGTIASSDVESGQRLEFQDQIYYENLGDEVIVNTRIRSCTSMHQIKYVQRFVGIILISSNFDFLQF